MTDKRPAWWPRPEQKAHADAGCAHPDVCHLPDAPGAPEHTGSMENDPTGLHPEPISREQIAGWARGPLSELDGDLGSAARSLVAALNPHPSQLEGTERIVADLATLIGDPESVIALRYVVETAVMRASAAPLMAPRGDQQGERVSGRAEPPLDVVFCGFHSLHPAHRYMSGRMLRRCLGMDLTGPRG